jgi:hypothetical protein
VFSSKAVLADPVDDDPRDGFALSGAGMGAMHTE